MIETGLGEGEACMNIDPRHHEEYDSRQLEAAHRVLIDIGQVLGSSRDCLVVVGG